MNEESTVSIPARVALRAAMHLRNLADELHAKYPKYSGSLSRLQAELSDAVALQLGLGQIDAAIAAAEAEERA